MSGIDWPRTAEVTPLPVRERDDGISVRVWVRDAPHAEQPYRLHLPQIPAKGDLVRVPWAHGRHVDRVSWDIDPARDPVLIADIYV